MCDDLSMPCNARHTHGASYVQHYQFTRPPPGSTAVAFPLHANQFCLPLQGSLENEALINHPTKHAVSTQQYMIPGISLRHAL